MSVNHVTARAAMKVSIRYATRVVVVAFHVWLGPTLTPPLNAQEAKLQANLKVSVNFVGEASPITLALNADGKLLASASGEKMAVLWDAVTGKEKARLEGHANAVTCVAFTNDGKLLASGSDDGTVKLWDAATGKEKATLKDGDA